jgi:hypothetical protein
MAASIHHLSASEAMGPAFRRAPRAGEATWFESDYYYPVRLGMLKRALGRILDALSASMAKKRSALLGALEANGARRCA